MSMYSSSHLLDSLALTFSSYLGKSAGAGSLSLWIHNLKDIKYIQSFSSKSCSGKTFQVEAGVTVQEIYHAADAQSVTVLGGICEVGHSMSLPMLEANVYLSRLGSQAVTFKVSSLLFDVNPRLIRAGGGHNPLNGFHGMAADAVLAYQIVTAEAAS